MPTQDRHFNMEELRQAHTPIYRYRTDCSCCRKTTSSTARTCSHYSDSRTAINTVVQGTVVVRYRGI